MKGIKENASYYHDYFCSNIKQQAKDFSIFWIMFQFSDTSGNGLWRLWPPLVQAAFQRQIQRDLRQASPGPGLIHVEVDWKKRDLRRGVRAWVVALSGAATEWKYSTFVTQCFPPSCVPAAPHPRQGCGEPAGGGAPGLVTVRITFSHLLLLKHQTWSQAS